jgi:hypothetical protein
VFSSLDFGKFLSKEFPSSPFLSKDSAAPGFDFQNVFKSKDSFSNLFSSQDWQTKVSKPEASPRHEPDYKVAPEAPAETGPMIIKDALQSMLTSKDWMPSMTLGPPLDVSIGRDLVLRREDSSAASLPSDLSTVLPRAKTKWDEMFMSQLQLMPPQPSPVEVPALSTQDKRACEGSTLPELAPEPKVPVTPIVAPSPEVSEHTGKKKRRRRPRQKLIPETKNYVEPQANDVLLGRGGRSNHHTGNKRYREEVRNLREWYASIGDNKEEKTKLSQTLVDHVHSYNGRFLEKDDKGWYVVPNVVARRKASQALREDDDPEKRAAKRTRFLTKRAGLEEVRPGGVAV